MCAGALGIGAVPGVAAEKPPTLRVLVTNDDGVAAPGIDALVQGLRKLDRVEVTVVAPADNKSGTSDMTTPGDAGDQPDDDGERRSRHRRAGLPGRHGELRARRRDPDQAAARRVGHQRRRQPGPCDGHLGHGGCGPHCGSPRRAGGRDQPGHDRGRGARLSRRCAASRHVGEGASQSAHEEEPQASRPRLRTSTCRRARRGRCAGRSTCRRRRPATPGRRPTARRR